MNHKASRPESPTRGEEHIVTAIPTHSMAGLPIARLSPSEARKTVLRWAESAGAGGGGVAVHFITAHTVSLAESDSRLRDILTSGDVLLPDSRWLHFLSGFRTRPVSQVRGPDFFRDVLALSAQAGIPHFFVFPSEAVRESLLRAVITNAPGVRISGGFVAPFRALTTKELDGLGEEIQSSGAKIVWIGVGTPAQNSLAHELARSTGCVVVGVGAAFEFFAGLKPEAPRWMSRMGVEWLFRLVSEPKRLWRRYLVGNTVFLIALAKHRRKPHHPAPSSHTPD